tara:strand:+ start:4921 stop:6915 length:1995 start_codon:yes stop_codon:yes gene_type:complete
VKHEQETHLPKEKTHSIQAFEETFSQYVQHEQNIEPPEDVMNMWKRREFSSVHAYQQRAPYRYPITARFPRAVVTTLFAGLCFVLLGLVAFLFFRQMTHQQGRRVGHPHKRGILPLLPKKTLKQQTLLQSWHAASVFGRSSSKCVKKYRQFRYMDDELPNSLNPYFADNMAAVRITSLLFGGLLHYRWKNGAAQVEGQLARSWKVFKGGKTVEIQLKRGGKWHDQKDVTADDVAFTIDFFKRLQPVWKGSSMRRGLVARLPYYKQIKGYSQLGRERIRIHFHAPQTNALMWLQFPILPKHRFVDADKTLRWPIRQDAFSRKPVGTGAYRYSRWFGRKIVLSLWDEQSYGPCFNKVVMQFVPSHMIRKTVLEYGGSELAVPLSDGVVQKWKALQAKTHRNGGARARKPMPHAASYAIRGGLWLMFSHTRFTKEPALKRALLHGLSYAKLQRAFLGRMAKGTSIPWRTRSMYWHQMQRAYPGGEQKSIDQRLLSAGWKRNADGVLMKSQKRAVIRLLVKRKMYRKYRKVIRYMSQSWRKLGIEVSLVKARPKKWRLMVFEQNGYDVLLDKVALESPLSLYSLLHSQGALNHMKYNEPKMDQLLDKLLASKGDKETRLLMKSFRSLVMKDLPIFPLKPLEGHVGLSRKLKHVIIHPFDLFHFFGQWR